MSLRTRLVTGSLYTLLASLAAQAIAMVTTIIYARLLSQEDFGVLAVFLQLGQLVAPLATLGLNVAITKYVAEVRSTKPEDVARYVGVAATLSLGLGVAFSVGYFLLASPLASFYGKPELEFMMRLSAAFLLLNALTTVLTSVIQGLQAIRRLTAVNLVTQATGIPLTFIFVSEFGLVGAAIGGVVFVAFATLLIVWAVRGALRSENALLRFHWNREIAGRLLRFSVPLFVSMILLRPALLIQASVVALWLTYGDLGLLRSASSLYRIALLLPSALSVPLLPAVSEVYATLTEERTREKMTSLLRLTMFLSLPLALSVGLGSALLIPLLYGQAYAPAAILLYVLTIAAFLDSMGVVAENTLLGTGRTWYILRLNVAQAAVLVGGSILLVPALGVIGAAYTTVLASAAYFAGAFVEFGRRREIAGKSVRDIAALAIVAFGASTVLVSVAGLENYLLSTILLAAVIVVELALLTPRDRAILRSSIKGVLAGIGRSSR